MLTGYHTYWLQVSIIFVFFKYDSLIASFYNEFYSKTPIYRRPWEQGKCGGKSGAAVNRGFKCLKILFEHLSML